MESIKSNKNRINNNKELPKVDTKEHCIANLKTCSIEQLEEIRYRQLNLLSNKKRLLKLPDKGKRIQDLSDTIEKELQLRNEINQAALLFSELNIAEMGVKAINKMEWIGKFNGTTTANINKNNEIVQDSDDEDDEVKIDPLKILAQSRNTNKTIKIIKSEPGSLITKADLDEINSFNELKNESITTNKDMHICNATIMDMNVFAKKKSSIFPSTPIAAVKTAASGECAGKLINISEISENPSELSSDRNSLDSIATIENRIELEPHANYVCQREKFKELRSKFLPHRTTKTDTHNVDKEKLRKICGLHWEITAATPPPLRNEPAKLLTLHDSIEIQRKQIESLKDIQEKHAQERLAGRDGNTFIPKIINPNFENRNSSELFKSYRDELKVFSESDDDSSLDDIDVNNDDDYDNIKVTN